MSLAEQLKRIGEQQTRIFHDNIDLRKSPYIPTLLFTQKEALDQDVDFLLDLVAEGLETLLSIVSEPEAMSALELHLEQLQSTRMNLFNEEQVLSLFSFGTTLDPSTFTTERLEWFGIELRRLYNILAEYIETQTKAVFQILEYFLRRGRVAECFLNDTFILLLPLSLSNPKIFYSWLDILAHSVSFSKSIWAKFQIRGIFSLYPLDSVMSIPDPTSPWACRQSLLVFRDHCYSSSAHTHLFIKLFTSFLFKLEQKSDWKQNRTLEKTLEEMTPHWLTWIDTCNWDQDLRNLMRIIIEKSVCRLVL